jgi:hypothetical protein
VNTPQLVAGEQFSPELVLVLPPECRARVIASMPPPAWATPRRHAPRAPLPARREPWAQALGAVVLARVAPLALIFVAGTILTLAMSVVAHAFP